MRELVKAKAEGQEIARAQEPPEATNVVDLMKVLEDSLQAAGSTRRARRDRRSRRKRPRRARPAGLLRQASRRRRRRGRLRRRRTGRPRHGPAAAATPTGAQELSKDQLYRRATEQDVPSRSKMSREQLIDALASSARRRKKSAA
ncbi:hypothetical protein ACIO02_23100 [Streptomyces sp. NPDC087568]|uniref:hypothetical protein n=1 Tax=Streptomyces sp. NPDC087568 TaxID=3365799 RepID=UPI0037FD37D1